MQWCCSCRWTVEITVDLPIWQETKALRVILCTTLEWCKFCVKIWKVMFWKSHMNWVLTWVPAGFLYVKIIQKKFSHWSTVGKTYCKSLCNVKTTVDKTYTSTWNNHITFYDSDTWCISGVYKFSKILGAMKQVLYWWATNVRCHHSKYSHLNNLAHGICAPLVYIILREDNKLQILAK